MYRTTLHTGNAVSRQIGPAVYDPRHETETNGVATLYVRNADGSLSGADGLSFAPNVDRDSAERYARDHWADYLRDGFAISIRVAGESVPVFIEMEPRPTVAASIDYARSILPADAILCGSVASRVSPTVRDVLFCLAGDRSRRVLSTWFEGSSLYGEW